jgi:hypothetical protein
MLYSVNLLSIKNGKFGAIWLLGSTSDRKQKHNKLAKGVVVRQMCSDILDLLPVGFGLTFSSIRSFLSALNVPNRLSLYSSFSYFLRAVFKGG